MEHEVQEEVNRLPEQELCGSALRYLHHQHCLPAHRRSSWKFLLAFMHVSVKHRQTKPSNRQHQKHIPFQPRKFPDI
eukprot:1472803-Amphidinium_carterae.1